MYYVWESWNDLDSTTTTNVWIVSMERYHSPLQHHTTPHHCTANRIQRFLVLMEGIPNFGQEQRKETYHLHSVVESVHIKNRRTCDCEALREIVYLNEPPKKIKERGYTIQLKKKPQQIANDWRYLSMAPYTTPLYYQ